MTTTTTYSTVEAMPASDEQLAQLLVAPADTAGTSPLGPDGLLQKLTKLVIEAGLEAEMSEHLGYDRHEPRAPTAATPATAPEVRPC